jgi:hypothetical protein
LDEFIRGGRDASISRKKPHDTPRTWHLACGSAIVENLSMFNSVISVEMPIEEGMPVGQTFKNAYNSVITFRLADDFLPVNDGVAA